MAAIAGRKAASYGRTVLILVLLVSLSGCGHRQGSWKLMNVSGLLPSLAFDLTDAANGREVQADAFKGRIVMLYFGYTHCPDVCPTTLAELGRAVRELGPAADQVRILFVTVDPRRDSLAVLKSYAKGFGPQVVGLRGDTRALVALTKRYRVSYGYGKPDADGNYTVSHSSAVYVFDRKGNARLLGKPTNHVDDYAHDLKELVAQE